MTMNPTVGRIVHMFAAGSKEPQAAIVVHVWSETCVNLTVFDTNGAAWAKTSVIKGAQETGDGNDHRDRWDWPARG